MNQEEELYKRIDQYLKGQLGQDDVNNFERELHESSSLNQKVKNWKLADEIILEHRLLSISASLKNVHTTVQYQKLAYRLVFALLLATIITGVILFFFNRKKSASDNLQEEKTQVLAQQSVDINSFRENNTAHNFTPNVPISKKGNSSSSPEEETVEVVSEITPLEETTTDHPEIPDRDLHSTSENIAEEKSTKTIDCKSNKINVSYKTSPSCSAKRSGSIVIREINGGTKPYKSVLRDENENEIHSTLIAPGTYYLEVTDAMQCQHREAFSITTAPCPADHAFNPFIGEMWTVPEYNQDGILSVADANGRIIYETSIYAGDHQTWDGTSIQGELKPGYFLYNIRYSDQSVVTGSITIIQ
jgi:hypothetical protein